MISPRIALFNRIHFWLAAYLTPNPIASSFNQKFSVNQLHKNRPATLPLTTGITLPSQLRHEDVELSIVTDAAVLDLQSCRRQQLAPLDPAARCRRSSHCCWSGRSDHSSSPQQHWRLHMEALLGAVSDIAHSTSPHANDPIPFHFEPLPLRTLPLSFALFPRSDTHELRGPHVHDPSLVQPLCITTSHANRHGHQAT